MASFNKITIVGYLGRDPELRYTPQGTPVCDFSVATTEKQKDNEVTTWFKITMWGKMGELASQYLTKGLQVYIEGRLSQREWQDREGNTRTSLEVTGTDMKFLSSKGDEKPAAKAQAAPSSVEVTEDDVPF